MSGPTNAELLAPAMSESEKRSRGVATAMQSCTGAAVGAWPPNANGSMDPPPRPFYNDNETPAPLDKASNGYG